MTLAEKHKEMDHLPGHKEWILLEDVCKEVDRLKETMKIVLNTTEKLVDSTSVLLVKVNELNKFVGPLRDQMEEDEECTE